VIPRRILLVGPSGQVGHELARALPALGEVTSLGRPEVDLARPETLREAVRALRPDVIVNAAAYTAVDRAEEEPEAARAVNAVGPAVLAEEAARAGALLVHYSTDYVFDGAKQTPYTEDDEPNPLSVYGRTKLEGEEAIRESGARHLILRTSWVYGAHGHNFLLTMLRLMAERPVLRVVADQHGSPTWSRYLAERTAALLPLVLANQASEGTYHATASGQTTWHGFAEEILGTARSNGLPVITEHIEPIPTREYPTPARRPAYSVMNTEKIGTHVGEGEGWERGLSAAMANSAISQGATDSVE